MIADIVTSLLLAQQGAEFLMRCVVLLRIEYAIDAIAVEQLPQQPLADQHMACGYGSGVLVSDGDFTLIFYVWDHHGFAVEEHALGRVIAYDPVPVVVAHQAHRTSAERARF
ncbi:hypothetical protein I5M01_29400 [Pseudomonas aeruginosa]|nr:hypothetical protein [Pseudomonas aeruginosa]